MSEDAPTTDKAILESWFFDAQDRCSTREDFDSLDAERARIDALLGRHYALVRSARWAVPILRGIQRAGLLGTGEEAVVDALESAIEDEP